MKTVFQTIRFLLAFAFIVSISQEVKAALNGSYTIDSSQVASSTNYRDFLSAVSDLKLGTRADGGTPNGTGISGPVVFNVAAGTFPGQLDITGITGVSASNTITFDGGAGNAATRIVTFTGATSVATAFTIKINNQQYINLRNLTITAGSPNFGWPLHIFSTSSNVTVKECIINFTTAFSAHTGTGFAAVVVNNSTASPTSAGTAANNIEIDSNMISGGYANYIYSSGTSTGITFRKNQVSNTYTYGLYLQGLAQVKVNNNDFNLLPAGNASSAGIYMTSCNAGAGFLFELNGNKITNAAQYGIFLNSAVTQVTPRSQMFNNAIAGGFRNTNAQGLYIVNNSSVSAWDVFHNSVNLDNVTTGANAAAFYVANCCNSNSTSNLDVRNNIFAVTAAGSSAVPFYYGSTTSLQYVSTSTATFDYNLYYKEGMVSSTVLFNLAANTYLTVANVLNNSGYNVNSKLGNPGFTAFNNLLPYNACNKGTGITSVTKDINGKTRSTTTPNMGAYEATPGGNDVGVESFVGPLAPFNAGSQNISVLIRNYGSNTINSANVSYSVNGGFPVTLFYSGSLAPCATATVTFSGGNQFNFLPNTSYNIKAYTDLPNGTTDTIAINDTLTMPVIYSAMSGNYTIDQTLPASATNFVSFTAAVNALNSGGVNGPVVFTVMDTTPYNEQVSLNNVTGTSAVNTITFDGGAGNAAGRILTYNTSVQASCYVFRINNTPWVTLRNLTIRSTGSSYGWPVHIMGNNASNNKIKSCRIDYVGSGNTSTGSVNFTGVVVNNSNTSVSATTTAVNIEIDSNTITGGECGIYVYGNGINNYQIRNNTFTNVNYYGMYLFLVYSSRINNNVVNMRPTGSVNSMGISLNNCYNGGTYGHELQNNIVNDAGQYGLYLYYYNFNGTAFRARVVNNMVGGTFRSTDPAGIYINNNAQNIDVWFNSVNLGNVATAAQAGALKVLSSVSGLDVRNNNLVVSDASSSAYPLYAEFPGNFNTLDYNNYYKPNATRLLNVGNTIYSSANFKGVNGQNANSVSMNPVYTSITNLRTNLLCNNGVAIAGVTTDFEGNTRNTPPDIGADENLNAASTDLAVIQLFNPSVPLTIGTQNLRVQIKNNGLSPIYSANISYSMNGSAPMDLQWTGFLGSCDSAVVEFNASSGTSGADQRFTILPGSSYTFKVYSSQPNLGPDGNTLNDTLVYGPYCPALAGAFTIDSAGVAGASTFTSFTSAILALNCGGISAPVTFNVLKGTYTGQLTLNDIPGISAVNTVTFDGGAGNDSTRIITFSSVSNAARHTWMINNARYISLNNLTIRGTGVTYGWPLHIFGSSSFITVKNCILVLDSNGATGTSDNFVPLVVNGSTTTPTGTGTFNNILIESNKLSGGNTSAYIYGNASNTNIAFRKNYLVGANTYGLYEYNVIAPKIIGNTVNMRPVSTTSTGLYLTTLITNATGIAEVNGNRVYDAGQYGVQLLSSTPAAQRANFLNNSIGGRFRNTTSPTGISISSSGSWNIVHNSVLIDTNATGNTTSGGIYITGSTLLDCRNNNFAIVHAGAGAVLLPFRSTAGVTFIANGLNYNNYYKGGTPTNLINVGGTDYTPTDFNTATSGGLNSLSNNSGYLAGRDLVPTLATNNGILLTALTNRDINDSVRNNPPDIGAFEIASGFNNDAGLVASISPDTALSSGIKNVSVVIKNFGLAPINSFNLRHTVNGASQQDSAFSGLNIAPGDTLTVTLSGSKSAIIPGGILTTYKVFIDNPNGLADDNQFNDTITIGPKIPKLNGIYTINPTGSGVTNFVSFRAATNALNVAGVSGPVTFQVSAATYNEQVNLGTIAGVSAVNTIAFVGGAGNVATTIIDTAANTTASYWTVKLNNSPYVTFRNLTINASGATYGVPVQISGTSDYSKIKNCRINITGAGATSTAQNYVGVLISSTTAINSLTANPIRISNLEIDSNTINSGYYGIYCYGITSTPYTNNNKIRNNSILNSYLYGAYFYYNEGVNFSNNVITLRWSTASSYGLTLDQCQNTTTNAHNISGNNFTRVNRYGIYVTGGNAVARNLMSNNMITGFNNTASYGLYFTNAYNFDVYHNTVNLDTLTNSQQYAAFHLSYGSNFDVKNNIFVTAQAGTGLPMYMPGFPSGYVLINNNNYYKFGQTNGTQVFYVNGLTYTPATLAGGSGYNTTSVSVNPGFVSNSNLHLTNGCAGKAPALASVTRDIDGDTRASLTNLGADEAIGLTNDAGIVAIKPFAAGLQDVKVLIRNYGNNPLTSVNVAYSVNGGLATITQWTGTLNPCDTVTVLFTGVNQYNFLAGTNYTIEAYTSQPNLAADPKTSNDSLVLGPTCIFLSGTYTINASGSGSSNFTSFNEAVAALNCGGVSAPVVFKVAPGTYNEQVVIGPIAGTSAINTVTFDGDSAANRTLTYNATTTAAGYTLKLEGANYVQFRHLRISNNGTLGYGTPIQISTNTQNIKIRRCRIEMPVNATGQGFNGILISSTTNVQSPYTSALNVANIEIDSNRILGGYVGVWMYGNSGPYTSNIAMRNNAIDSAYQYGVYMFYGDKITFENNVIYMREIGVTGSYGISFNNCYAQGTNIHTVINNRIYNAGAYGIYMYFTYGASTTARCKMINNVVGGNFRTSNANALYMQYSYYWDVWNNTFNFNYPTSSDQYSTANFTNCQLMDIRNNHFVYNAIGGGLPLNIATAGQITTLDYNNYYNLSGGNLINNAGTYYNSASFIGGGGYNLFSRNVNPGFASNLNLAVSNACINGITIPAVPTDILGVTRNSPPDIGAYEFTGSINNDIGVSYLNSPAVPFAPGSYPVNVRISNFGANAITSAVIKYSINGAAPVTYNYSGNLNACDTVALTISPSPLNFVIGNSYAIKVWSELPNGTTDGNRANDTFNITSCPALPGGNYTINASGSGPNNFTSFTAVANVLNCGGIAGPVTFTVAPGTYTEQVTLQSVIGASATNTITFDGVNAATRILDFAPTTNNFAAHTFRISNTPYVMLRNLTISSSGASFGNPVHIMGTSDNAKVKNCVLTFNGTAQSSTSSYYIGLLINNEANIYSPTNNGTKANNMEIDSNRIMYGYYGILDYGIGNTPYATNNVYRNNSVDSTYYYGIYIGIKSGFKLFNNIVSMKSGNANSNGMYLYNNNNNAGAYHEVVGNRVRLSGRYGIYVYFSSNTTSPRGRIVNNMIGGGFSSNTARGLFLEYSNYWDIFNNTVNLDFATNSNQNSAMMLGTSSSNNDIRNNHFAYTAATGTGIAMYSTQTLAQATLNYNNYYNATSATADLVYTNGVAYNPSNFVVAAGVNSNSLNQNPGFSNRFNLSTGGCFKGVNITSVTTDIDGQIRNNPPDIGADEADTNDVGIVSISAPVEPVTAGPQDIVVQIKNYGGNVINTLSVSYNVNNTGVVTRNLTALNLQPCGTTTVTFTGANQFNFPAGRSVIIASIASPNGNPDRNGTNDTLRKSLCGPLSGSYTISASGTGATNFISFNEAVNTMLCAGITGPVTFNVGAGTYNEQVTMPVITGASATNTITFDGGAGNAASRILTFGTNDANARHTVRFNSQYVTFRNITIQTTGANYGWGVHFPNNANNNNVIGCIVDIAGATALTSASTNYSGIVVSNSNTSPTTAASINNIRIDSNTVKYGYYSIVVYGNTTTSDTNIYVRGNTVANAYGMGIYAYYLEGFNIDNNTVSTRGGGVNLSQYGIYLANCVRLNTANAMSVSANKVFNVSQNGIYIAQSNGLLGASASMNNNMVGGGFQSTSATGIYLFNGSSNWDVYNNSVNLDYPTTSETYAAMMVYVGISNIRMKNNNLAVTATGSTGLPLYSYNATSFPAGGLNYNNYYKVDGTPTSSLIQNGGTYNSLNFNIGGGAASFNRPPGFRANLNLHTVDGCFNGDSLGLMYDIDGDLRASYADIGADEVTDMNNDIGITALLKPTIPLNAGLSDIQVIVKNYGTNPVYKATVSYSVNGAFPITEIITDTILPCDTALVTFTGLNQYNFASGSYSIKAYTSLPNDSTDLNFVNDTFTTPQVCLAMSGAYTIDAAGAGPNNFTSFQAALTAMQCSGVSGPVTFTVAAGTYNEQLVVNSIAGASSTNRIVFTGGAGNASTRILTFGATNNTNRQTVRFSGAMYVSFEHLTIRNSGATYAWPVHIYSASRNIILRNNIIEITGTGYAGASTDYTNIVVSGSTTNPSTVMRADSIEIDSNTINGGYASIYDYNGQALYQSFNGNTFNNPNYYGIYIYNSYEVKIRKNTINMSPTGNINSVGLYLFVIGTTTGRNNEISGNKIVDMGQYGIYLYSSSGFSNIGQSRIENNMIGGGFRNTTQNSGIWSEYSSNWNIWFNSINMDTACGSITGAIHMTNGSALDVRNNIFAVTYSGSNANSIPLYAATTANTSALNYNNYFKAGSVSTLIYHGSPLPPSGYIGVAGFNNNSFSIDPLFTSARDLHVNNGCNNGVAIAGSTVDFDGNARTTPPDVGADEVTTGFTDNIGVTAILKPSMPLATGAQDVVVILANLGNNVVTNATISYSVNGGAPVTQLYTDSLQPCDTALIVFTGTNGYNFAPGTAYTVKAYTSYPNGIFDNNMLDDTITYGPVCPSMSGAYTIDPAGSGVRNFVSFNAAVNALGCAGVSDDVTFTVANATYTEQVSIAPIQGVNDTNRVTFIGQTKAGVVLTFNAFNPTSAHTLRLNNSSYITFRNMTIQSTGGSYGLPVHIMGGSNSTWVKNCVIRVGGAGTTSTSSYFIAVLANNATDITNPGSNGSLVNNLEIDSNTIFAGYYSIYLSGRTSSPYSNNNMVRGNTIDSSYYYGYYAYYHSGVKFNDNRVTMRSTTGTTASMGAYLYFCYNNGSASHEVTGNKVINAGNYGINVYYSTNTAAFPGKFYNNMIGGGFRTNSAYGAYFFQSNYWNIYHNSINMDFATANNQYAALYISGGANNNVRNNILAYSATTGTGLPVFITGTYSGTMNNNNYNNAVSASAVLLNINGVNADPTNYTTNGGGANSYNAVTGFASAKDLALVIPNVKGATGLGVLTDIDGQTRNTPPDVGADEYFGVMDIGVLAIDSPTTASFCGKSRNIIVRLRNYGNQTVTNTTINYSINGIATGYYAWTGTLAPGATSAQINIASYPFTGGAYTIAAQTFMPNGLLTDTILTNDTAFKSFNTTPSVTPTISLSASQTTLCSGVEVTFITTYSGGGSTPSLQWRKNGLTLPFTGDTLKTTALNDGDSFIVILSSSATCATPATVISNHVKMNVGLTVAPDVTIASSTTTICAGQSVQFTATPLNGGSAPTYTWLKNGIVVGGDSAKYVDATLQHNDSVRVVLNSSLGCASPPKDTSSYIKMTVNPLQYTSATISASATSFCAGSGVTFAATTVNQGNNPIYQWKRNGIVFGPNNDTLVTTGLNNSDSISLTVISDALCATPVTFESNKIGVNVIALVTPSVTIATTTGTICTGSNATFTATPVKAGVNATYNWTVNSVPSGTGSTFASTAFNNNDTIRLVLTADTLCASPQQVTSNGVVIKVKQYVAPGATITPLNPAVCAGGSVSFTATPVNGGTAPSYQWLRNGVAVGTDSVKYQGIFNTNDSVAVVVTSNEMCLSTPTATSAYAQVIITAPVTPAVSVSPSASSVCANGSVTLTATPVNGGTTPAYQWKKNGTNVGTNNPVQVFGSINSNDSFWVVLTSNAGCAVPTTAASVPTKITVIPNVTPGVTTTASASSICAGGSVTFTATPVNGGAAPSYQWKKNGTNVGTDSAVQTFTGINNNDNFTVVMTSNANCALPATATSTGRVINVTPNVTPAISIVASKTSICLGESVTFSATSTNAGGTPSYQWKVNGVDAGTNSNTFTSTAISGTDSVYVVLTSSLTCVTSPTATSNKIKLNANPALVPSVSVQATATNVCMGTSITFAATTVNGGTAPNYQWKINGVNVGSNNDSFTTSTLTNNDSVFVVLTSNALCASPAIVTSAKTGVTINTPVAPTIQIVASASTICKGTAVTYTATIGNGGTTPTYKWLKNGVQVGTNSNTYTTTDLLPDEDVTCILTTSLTCVTSPSVTAFAPGVLVKLQPAKPTIVRTANTLSTAFASQSYQWIKNDTDITSATAPTYLMTANGMYSVRVDSNGCTSTSDKLTVTDIFTGLAEASTIGSISLYPNPAELSAHLQVNFITSEATEITLVDMYGKLVKTIPLGTVNSFEGNISLDELADGVYFVLIKHGDDMAQKRLVKAVH